MTASYLLVSNQLTCSQTHPGRRFWRSGALVFALIGAGITGAHAQLYDPNQHCTYRPGSTVCEAATPLQTPPISGSLFEQFLRGAQQLHIDLRQHATYSEYYVVRRAASFCELLGNGDFNGVTRAVTLPPVNNWTETPFDRSRLEVLILRLGALNDCRQSWSAEQQWERTNMR